MPWDQEDRGRGGGEPPPFEDVVERIKSFFRRKKTPGGKSIWVVLGAVILGIILLATSVYTVPTGYRGVLLRFGKYAGIVGEGLHLKIPFGVDTIYKVHTAKVDTEAFGFRTARAGIRSEFARSPSLKQESLMLTGDLNVIDVEWIVQFRREDPRKFLFNVRDPVQAIRDVSQSVIRRIVGDWSFDYVLRNREEVNRIAKREIQAALDAYDSGLTIVDLRLQNVVPPDEVKGAFNAVNEAQAEKERFINQAEETKNKQIPRARGVAERTIRGAEGYALERTNRAEGDVVRFREVLKAYQTSKEVTKRRLYLETLQEILPKAKQIYILDDKQKGILPLLQLQEQAQKGGGLR